eukprot:c13982_g2_i1 orf=436-2622(-)
MKAIADLNWLCHGGTTCRKEMPMPAALARKEDASFSEKKLNKRQRKAQFFLQNHFRNGKCFSDKLINAQNRDLRYMNGNSLRIFNTSVTCSAWINQVLDEIRVKISSEVGCKSRKEYGRGHGYGSEDFNEISSSPTGASGGGYGEGGSGCGSGNGGAGRQWGSRWGDSGDEGSDGFHQLVGEGHAHLLFFLGLFNKHVGTKVLIPALLLQLFLHRVLLANADGITPPLKPSLDSNGSKVCVEQDQASSSHEGPPEPDAIFQVQGGIWKRLWIDTERDEFVVDPMKESNKEAFDTDDNGQNHSGRSAQDKGLERSFKWCSDFVRNLMLPDGYPNSVTEDYLDYTLWRMGQNIASQINGVLTTQALLYAVGLGKGAIPTAAAVNWVLKDGIGYLSKILLAKYGRHFDVHPKGWRLLADLIENASYGLELLTPIYPHLFVYLGAAAGAGKSAAGLIQAATRSCFYAGFAAQRNFAEVIAKGEAQGMVSKSIGIALGIAISAYVGASGPPLVATFLTVTGVHMFCNLRSYQAVQLRTLNPYRASLVFTEYIRSGVIPSVEEVNAEEPIFTEGPLQVFKLKGHQENASSLLSLQTKENAATIATMLNLGVSFANVIRSQKEADELFKIYQDEQYILSERQNTYQALLKVGATSHDLLKLMLQVCYLYQLQNGPWRSLAERDMVSHAGGPLEISYKLAVDKIDLVQQELASAGWSTSVGLVSRPLTFRLLKTST